MDERPLCDYCDCEILDDHFFMVNGEAICIHCMNEYFRQELEPAEEDEDE